MITVTIDSTKHENPVHQGMHVLAQSRQRGVPAVGVLWPVGVEHGELRMIGPDILTGEVEYVWRPA